MSVGAKLKIQCSDTGTLFFPDFLSAQNMVWVILGKIVLKWTEEKQNLLWVSWRFELLRIRVTEGKITVNVYENPGEINFGSS